MKMFRACALLTCYYIIGGQVENHYYLMRLVVDTLKPLDEIVKEVKVQLRYEKPVETVDED